MQRSTSNIPVIMERNPGSPLAESYRTLRTYLALVSEPHARPRVISITSSQSKEGKSTTAVNTAIALAQTNNRVLLIDGNVKEPVLHLVFMKSNRYGLCNLLMGQCDLIDAIEQTHIPNLNLMPSGTAPYTPTELFATNAFEDLLNEVRKHYDVVIIDSPAVLSNTDAQIIAARCDGVMMVAHAGKVKKQSLLRARLILEQVKAKVLGVVLNQVKKSAV